MLRNLGEINIDYEKSIFFLKILLDNIGTADEVDDFRYITEG